VPFGVAATFTVIVYALTAVPIFDEHVIKLSRIGEYYAAIGRGEYDQIDYALCCIGLKPVNFANWFVLVTLVVYILFFIVKTCIGLSKRLYCVLGFTFGFIMFAFCCKMAGTEYMYREGWAIILGLVLALYEKSFLHSLRLCITTFIVVNIYLLGSRHGLHYMLKADTALLTLVGISLFCRRYTLRGNGLIVWLAGMSYYIYLYHTTIMNAQWYYVGHISLLLIIVETLLLSWILSKPCKVVIDKLHSR